MKKMMIYIIFGLLLMIALVCIYLLNKTVPNWKDGEIVKVIINNQTINAEISSSAIKKARGLSGKTDLNQDSGMLFVFDKSEILSFWMKDMNFPLDFIWINGDKIVDLSENVIPSPDKSGLPIIHPKNPSDKVLEVNSGIVKKLGIQEGQNIIFGN